MFTRTSWRMPWLLFSVLILTTATFFLSAEVASAQDSATFEAADTTSISGNITVFEPDESDVVSNPILITGEARVFENTVEYRLKDANGTTLVKGFTTARSPDVGQFGPFQIYAPYMTPTTDTGVLEVFSTSAEDGSEINKVTVNVRFTAPTTPPPTTPPPTGGTDVPTQPLYRLYNERITDHFYTTSVVERDTAASRLGYIFEGTAGHVFSSQAPGTVPLYRLYNAARGDHFYTVNVSERDAAVSRYGYRSEGITGYVRSNDNTVTTALYRLFNARIVDHFYTVNIAERDRAVNTLGYRSEGVAGYIGPAPESTLVRVYLGNTAFNPNTANCSATYPITREVPKTVAVAGAAIEQLLTGPTGSETGLGYYSVLPAGTEVNSIGITNGTATIDFNSVLNTLAGSCAVTTARAQIERTLLQFPTVNRVVITVNGSSTGVLQP